MKYICALLSVRDIHAAKAFYQELFGLEVAQDYGRNIAFTCGLALQQDFDWLIGVPSLPGRMQRNLFTHGRQPLSTKNGVAGHAFRYFFAFFW